MTIYNLHHADSDGYFAGWCVFDAHRNEHTTGDLKSIAVQYNQALPFVLEELSRSDVVYIVDFSYPRDILIQISQRVGKLVVLDHHEKAMLALQGIESDLDPACQSLVVFDMNKSGALLAWEYFNPHHIAPHACLLVNDRDLWQWAYGDTTAAFEAYLNMNGVRNNWSVWDKLIDDDDFMKTALTKGMAALDYQRSVVKNFMASDRNLVNATAIVDGKQLKFLVYEGMGILTSELGTEGYTTRDVDFTIEHRIREDKMVFSLRSNKVDVGALALAFPGGGGHCAAAGFSVSLRAGLDLVHHLRKSCKVSEVVGAYVYSWLEIVGIAEDAMEKEGVFNG